MYDTRDFLEQNVLTVKKPAVRAVFENQYIWKNELKILPKTNPIKICIKMLFAEPYILSNITLLSNNW